MIRLCANILESDIQEYPKLYMRSFKDDQKKILSVHKEKFAEYDNDPDPEWEPIPYPRWEIYVLPKPWTEQLIDDVNKTFKTQLTMVIMQIIIDFL